MDSWVPLIVAMLGAGGLGAFIREIASVVRKLLGGVSARETKRKVDLVEQRDVAIKRELDAWERVDREAEKRRIEQDYSSRLRRQLIELGIEPDPAPVHEATITRSQLLELQNQENQ